ncbi:MAG: RNase adaptor protein RapZ [Candidatus Wallbacteria bacterium GWC2_49_35]|uniref:RNase adaptor protein RapZ n=1 Tax=Candidatus Wallbacteria bacterium GWC2_49_35 TaxID=1817813 RepID=A0A1F7WN02_9BACT|nr:MAG: RNase adaptor protein RapZ [Candidatus Wallbacteria bacterium GWC2_49_35]
MQFVIVTGLSGAGRTSISHAFEDLNFFVVDNMPPELIPKFGEICIKSQKKINRVLLVLDIRGGFTPDELFGALNELTKMNIFYRIIFLDASDQVLVKRFSETRRKHPLGDKLILKDAIEMERSLLAPIREKATFIINTSKLTVSRLKEMVAKTFADIKQNSNLIVNLVSFGYKHGIPDDADIILDLRFLPNPFYEPDLKQLTGLDKKISDYILGHQIAVTFKEKLFDFIDFLLPEYVREGKSKIEIALGCTGGQHRSVLFCELLNAHLAAKNYTVIIKHREIN